jgi:hypothetical protein
MPIRDLLLPSVEFVVLAGACLGCTMRPSPPPPALLIRDVTILSMDDEPPRRGSVLVRGDRIEYDPVAFMTPLRQRSHMLPTLSRCLGLLLSATLQAPLMQDAPGSSRSAVDGVLRLWDRHQIVAIAELHRGVEDKQFFRTLIAHPEFPTIVDDVVVEFANSRFQATLDRYIEGAEVRPEDVRRVWADTTVVNGLWDAPVYAEFLAAVRDRNRSLPRGQRVRVLACDPPIDWTRVSSIADAAGFLDRDGHCAATIEREVMARRRRALVIMGDAHLARRTVAGQTATNTLSRVETTRPGSAFVVLMYAGQFSESPAIETRLAGASAPVLVPFSEAWLGDLLAVPPKPPTRTRVGPGQTTTETVAIVKPPRFREVGDALLYLGPKAALTRSVPDAAHWSPEAWAELERRHQILFGKPLDRSAVFK